MAIQVMEEVGIDISKQRPKDLTEDMMRNSTKIINMGCMEKDWCPTMFVPNLVDWGIEDPKGKPIEKIREIRDEIEQRVKGLTASIPKEN
jgi:protein-tyrosine-phosphatase